MTYKDIAIKYASRSSIKRHKTGAVLVTRTGRVIYGWSHVSHLTLKSADYSMHAEIHCIFRAKRVDLRGAEIYVATLAAKSGNVVDSEPCDVCCAALAAAGVTGCHFMESGKWRFYDPSTRTARKLTHKFGY